MDFRREREGLGLGLFIVRQVVLAHGGAVSVKSADAFFALPLVGPVRAGLPQPADAGQAPEALSVETFLVDHPDKTIYCQVKGDSMRDAGLLDGNIVVVDRSAQAKAGEIVVAVVVAESKFATFVTVNLQLLRDSDSRVRNLLIFLAAFGICAGTSNRHR